MILDIFEYYNDTRAIAGQANNKFRAEFNVTNSVNVESDNNILIKNEWVKICEGQDFLYRQDDGTIITEEEGIHCFWVYSWDDPPGVPIYLDGLGGGGGSGTFTVLHSLGDQTTFTPIDYSTSSNSRKIKTILNYIRYTNFNGGLTVNLNDIFKNIPDFSKTVRYTIIFQVKLNIVVKELVLH